MSGDDVADKTAPGSSTLEEKRKEQGVSWRVFIYIAGSHLLLGFMALLFYLGSHSGN
ncbi:DUF6126 family protein [Streptomyces celluloflavus]